MIRAAIIEDELQQRIALKEILKLLCPDVSVVAESDSVADATDILLKHSPELVFLDIRLRDGIGLDILKALEPQLEKGVLNFHVIFLTAYQEYAIKAIRYSALDYLLKPIDPDELAEAVNRYRKKNSMQQRQQYELLHKQYKEEAKAPKKLVLNTADRIHIVSISDIIRCEARDNYTIIYIKDSQPVLVSRTLKEYEEMLEPFGFSRIHQSHLVNFEYVKTFIKADGGYLQMHNDDKVPVSHRKKEQLLEMLRSL